MLLRALLAFLVLPGVVAYLVPLWIAGGDSGTGPWRWTGAILLTVGTGLLVWCAHEFYVLGRGTLAPWSPPRNLVTSGPYRRSRNPMYVAVLIVLLGWCAWFTSRGLLAYTLFVAIAFQLRIVLYEEPRLGASFGDAWQRYRSSVRRWL